MYVAGCPYAKVHKGKILFVSVTFSIEIVGCQWAVPIAPKCLANFCVNAIFKYVSGC